MNTNPCGDYAGQGPAAAQAVPPPAPAFWCDVCQVGTTDAKGMQMHYESKKHDAKAQKLGHPRNSTNLGAASVNLAIQPAQSQGNDGG